MSTGPDVRQAGSWTVRRVAGWLGLMLGVAAAVLVVVLLGGKDAESASTHAEPAVLEIVEGDGPRGITLTVRAAERLGIQTVRVRASGKRTVVPYAALIYDPHGATWVYTSPDPLEFLRVSVEVERVEGALAYLSKGPSVGTDVVTTGAAEMYGTEFELGH